MATKTTSTTSRNQGASAAMPQHVFMVGNNNALEEIKDKLTNSSKEREVISITGMGGIGKTTLAKNVYEDKDIKRHFDIRAWITVSQSYSLDDLLRVLLQSIDVSSPTEEQSVLLQSIDASSPTEEQSAGTFELKDKVRKLLLGKRYLIAIDDIWSTQVWDDLKICFPSEKRNGSRVLLTTRLTNVATHASSGGLPFSMPTLSKEESWDLFCKKIFAKESCPPIEFQEIGRDIVMKCKGLPLSIILMAGILSKAKMKVEDWENVARDVALSSTLYEEQNCEKILLLSYNHLPENLKTCFLYLGVFPEDYEIPVRRLVGYWVAQGFVEDDEALVANNKEEVGWQKLQDLIDRNLIFVEKRGCCGRIKTCKIHDLTHEMCLRLAKGKNILHVIDDKFHVGQSSKEISQEEEENGNFWVSLQSISNISRLDFEHRTLQKCHSFLAMFPSKYGFGYDGGSPIFTNYLFTATSIQVLDLQFVFPYLPASLWINNLSQLRYLALHISAFSGSLSILSSLKNLQTLILYSARPYGVVYLTLPKTPQLRELCILKGPSFHFKDDEENLILENLTTFLWLSDLCCNNEALMVRIPNVKKLGVRYEKPKRRDNMHPIDLLHTLSHLEQLEDIRFYGYQSLRYNRLVYIPKPYDFPPKLKKLKFSNTWMILGITMTILGRLPNLEVLQLKWNAFDDSETEWEQVEEGFPKLKVLVFQSQSLCRWKDSDFTFPSLECLVLKNSSLKSLPYESLSGCPCLKIIHLEGLCSDGVLESAKKIQNDGDGLLEVREENIYIMGAFLDL
ncbi:putative late blight resistance protein homolog R1B-8 [Ipomoea triloba]|uniref:putative late blight resistance protein homolog R1B-8 n=1 Tax=Ipomoea triloba TaxID=35885 RepID=UPI00125E4A7B|nr:putative late blight resistance protein homolog R1B-8 [Ipomoea triloba]XP_031100363.1 putative late blight resistance protein homolog R1B-8 [Ipomoea triloba]XP_031100364.1 putative late blight resistance protein homolog R1B-8 [Ipomoea triloba]XP_031100365.1 putative late blight resistance protein homolog R1B-8 [Ipomoea triloba]